MQKRPFLKALGSSVALAALPSLTRAQGQPIRVGSTMSMTGPLAATAIIHKISTEIFIENLNKRGGLLGRQIEWVMKDDQSKPDLARTQYEQLVTVDKVDLLMGPYATANSLAAMGVAQRYSKFIITTGIFGAYNTRRVLR